MVSGCPDVGDVLAVFLARFVIEDLVVDDVAASLEAGNDAGVGRDAVTVFPYLEGLDEYGVGVAVVCDHQVLVAAAGADWEASCVVCVERADGFYPYVEFFDGLGTFLAVGSRWGGEGGLAILGGADALLGFGKVALDGILTGGAVPRGIGVGDTRPGGEVASFDGGEPGGFDWEYSGSVEVADEGTNTGEIVGAEGSRGCRSRGTD